MNPSLQYKLFGSRKHHRLVLTKQSMKLENRSKCPEQMRTMEGHFCERDIPPAFIPECFIITREIYLKVQNLVPTSDIQKPGWRKSLSKHTIFFHISVPPAVISCFGNYSPPFSKSIPSPPLLLPHCFPT